MHWQPLCHKVFFMVLFPKPILLPQGSCEHHLSETLTLQTPQIFPSSHQIILSLQVHETCLIEAESLFHPYVLNSYTINSAMLHYYHQCI